jgi:hypothetical protein
MASRITAERAKMFHRTSHWPLYPLIFSTLAVAGMQLVQSRSVPGSLETMIRMGIGYSAPIVVPILLTLALRSWLKTDRLSMRDWRNSLGLSSFVLLTANSVFQIFLVISVLSRWQLANLPIMDLYVVSVVTTAISFVLAFSLKGNSRFSAIAAALLMVAWQQSTIYS